VGAPTAAYLVAGQVADGLRRASAQGLYRSVCTVHPCLEDLIRVDLDDDVLARG
jgi:hypothetical protein